MPEAGATPILDTMRDLPIGIFDSGLGGLTVAGEIMRALPDESIIYLGDTARCPYGPRSQNDVRRFVLQIGRWLSAREVKLIVVACNTATAAGLPLAQQAFDVPVIGVVEPGARAAVKATVNRRVGVIGTVGTIESGAYSQAARAIDAGVTVFSTPAPRFVDLVEQGLRLGEGTLEDLLSQMGSVYVRPAFYEMARDYLDPLKRSGVDTLVLGCTHFPLLETAIQQVMGSRVRLISSAEETAREVAETLTLRGHRAGASATRAEVYATTGDPDEFGALGARIIGRGLGTVKHVDVAELEALFDHTMAERLREHEADETCG
ncbi:MAG TPA: glutamate racemase [Coriobacteriia bacterium]|nr:MAG: Glutamate racemase [Actinobacteria bacterium 66_15]HAL29189.1 glutamate racemase [Coriobacteriia bacterium]